MINARLVRAPFGDGFCAFHLECSADFTNVSCWLCFHGEFAVRVVRTGVEWAEASPLLHNLPLVTGDALNPSSPL